MKNHQNRSKTKRQLFEAVLRKWYFKRYADAINFRQCRRDLTRIMVANTIGVAAFMCMGTMALAKDNNPALLPEVVVSGRQEKKEGSYKPGSLSSPKYSAPLRDIPQTISVIPQAVMQEQGATTLRDVLRNTPGISIQAGEGGVPAGDNLSIRGFSARTDISIDGVRDFGGYSRDSFNFEQIEVIKGPSSAYSGRGSTGGSVNMVSKAPQEKASFKGTAGAGTEEYGRVTLDMNQPLKLDGVEGAAFRLNTLWHTSEVANRDEAENERWGVAPSLVLGLGTPTRLTLSYFHLDQDNVPDYGIPWVPNTNVPLIVYREQPAPVDWSNFYGLKSRDYEEVKTDIGSVEVEHDFSDELSLRNITRYGETYRDSIITAPRFAAPTGTAITRTDWKSRDQKDTILINQTDVTMKFETADIEHTFVPGIEFAHETDVNYTRVKTGIDSSTTDLYNPNPDDAYLENIQRNGAKIESGSNSIALYAFDTIKLTDQWELNGGLRWDYFNLDYASINPNGTVAADLGRIDRMLNWRTGVVYKPQENGSIYAAYGTSSNPSAEGLSLGTTATATNNIATDPEESQTYELGTKWDFLNERLALSTAIFRTDKTNARTEDPTNAGDTIVLDGKQRVDGIEFGVSGDVTDKWSMFGAYTIMLSEVRKSNNAAEVGNELSNTPQHTASLWNTYQLPFKFEVGAGVQFVGDRFTSNTNARRAPSYLIGDAMLAYKVNSNVTVRLNAYNLGDLEYIDRVGGGHFIPGPGRSATLSTDFKF